jgi:hypothetical protein
MLGRRVAQRVVQRGGRGVSSLTVVDYDDKRAFDRRWTVRVWGRGGAVWVTGGGRGAGRAAGYGRGEGGAWGGGGA